MTSRVYIRSALCASLALIFVLPFTTGAQSAEQIRAEIDDHNAQIAALNKEIAAYEKQLTQIGTKKQTLQNTIDQLNIQRKKLTASISVTKNKIGALELEIQSLSRNIAGKQDSIQLEEAGLAQTLRRLNETERVTLATAMLSSEDMSSMWNEMDTDLSLQEALKENINTLSEQKKSLSDTRTATELKQAELVKQRNNLLAEQGSLDATRKAQNDLLTQTKSQESNFQAILAQKQAAKASFEAALESLESKLQYTLDPSRIPPAGKGVLRWPLDNIHITQQFGRTSDSGRLYASGTHNGVDFRAAIGTPVKAALSGTVTATGNTDAIPGCYSYGKWILIKHGNGLSTLYAHLSQINVSQGQSVSTGSVIGYSGSTGYATGPHLHLTVYASEAVQVRQLGSGKGCNDAVMPVAAQSAYFDPMQYL